MSVYNSVENANNKRNLKEKSKTLQFGTQKIEKVGLSGD